MQENRVAKILLVDDDRVTNLLNERLISKAEVADRIEVETDGAAALEHLQRAHRSEIAPPDLIFLDINMPRMSGFEFLEAYRELPEMQRNRHMIVMLSTSELQRDFARAEADPNVYRFVPKPLQKEQLEALVSECRARRSE
ncbi:response regulator [uncultured Roseobacter sp.]|uniref:response regulator n=1 Tax=uncultured Roseobacter sp. TaxID=114847 RepID=UPI002605BA23|nr:response regulator [uncultured Roseobacter sp.]